MARRIQVTGVPRKKPEVGLYVLALIALARQIQEQGRQDGAQVRPEATAAGGEEVRR